MEKQMVVESADPNVQQVWDHWLTVVHGAKPGLTPALSEKRARAICKALKAYPVEVCKQAIDGVLLSPFHMGRNSRNKRYNDITLILRDPEHIEKFVALVDGQTHVDDARDAFLAEAVD
jgi:hypothetical protein